MVTATINPTSSALSRWISSANMVRNSSVCGPASAENNSSAWSIGKINVGAAVGVVGPAQGELCGGREADFAQQVEDLIDVSLSAGLLDVPQRGAGQVERFAAGVDRRG